MNINDDGVEIDSVGRMEVYGDWVRFTDGEGAPVKIPPYVIKKLMDFAIGNANKFEADAWVEE